MSNSVWSVVARVFCPEEHAIITLRSAPRWLVCVRSRRAHRQESLGRKTHWWPAFHDHRRIIQTESRTITPLEWLNTESVQGRIPFVQDSPFLLMKSISWWGDWHHRIQSWSDHHDRDCYNRIWNHWWNQHLIRDWFSLWMEKNHCWNATVKPRSVSYTCCTMEHDPPFCFYLPSLPTSIVENKNDQVFHYHTGKPKNLIVL